MDRSSALAVLSIVLWVALVLVLATYGSFNAGPVLGSGVSRSAATGTSASGPPTVPPQTSVSDLQAENQRLQQQVQAFQSLQQDLMAQQVYEKAWGKLVSLFTLGGIITGLLGLIGYREAMNVIRQKSDQKIGEITKDQVEKMLQAEARQQIAAITEQQAEELRQFTIGIREQQEKDLKTLAAQLTQQSIAQIQVSTSPLTGVPEETTAAAPTTSLARKVDYAGLMGPARDQGQEGAVVGFAVAATMEYQILKTSQEKVVISPRFIYNLTRAQEGTAKVDAGAQIRDAVRLVTRTGAVEESVWPYVAGEFAADPPAAVKDAKHYKIKRSRSLKGLDAIKDALQATGPIVGGFTVYQSMMSDEVRKSGIVPMPEPSDPVMGGHSACFVGYDDDTQLLKFRNSWGVEWGEQGYGYMPYAYATVDAWALVM